MLNNEQQLESELSETCKELIRTQRQLKRSNLSLQLVFESISKCATEEGVEVKTVEDVQKFMQYVSTKLDRIDGLED